MLNAKVKYYRFSIKSTTFSNVKYIRYFSISENLNTKLNNADLHVAHWIYIGLHFYTDLSTIAFSWNVFSNETGRASE